MRSDWKITCYKPERQGVFSFPGGVKFAATFSSKEECGILLYGPKGKEVRIPFSPEGQRGNLYGIIIEGIDTAKSLCALGLYCKLHNLRLRRQQHPRCYTE